MPHFNRLSILSQVRPGERSSRDARIHTNMVAMSGIHARPVLVTVYRCLQHTQARVLSLRLCIVFDWHYSLHLDSSSLGSLHELARSGNTLAFLNHIALCSLASLFSCL